VGSVALEAAGNPLALLSFGPLSDHQQEFDIVCFTAAKCTNGGKCSVEQQRYQSCIVCRRSI
jgi:hypothetical protein